MNNLLDKDKVIGAIRKARNNMYMGYTDTSVTVSSDIFDTVNDALRVMIATEAKKLIVIAFDSFTASLTTELQTCEPDKYPCALCHEEENENESNN